MNGHYVKYAPLLTKKEYQILLPKKSKTILNLESVSLLKNIQFLAGKESSYISYSKWGKYLPNVKSNMDSLLRLPAKNDSLYSSGELSDISISYLEKTVAHLKNKQIKVVLVRTPLHPLSLTLKNESSIQHFRKERLSDVDFIDFKDFPSNNNDRADYMHLNYRGARKFSIFFNNLLQQGLLDSVDKQAFINQQMELLKDSEHR
ncbi:MAG: SGNH/GDSL hydrolase family protein [Bacteroidetes bacterium]|nr:SGNH/GDSL hydrolase family protein [Bacteroidota bacterium]